MEMGTHRGVAQRLGQTPEQGERAIADTAGISPATLRQRRASPYRQLGTSGIEKLLYPAPLRTNEGSFGGWVTD